MRRQARRLVGDWASGDTAIGPAISRYGLSRDDIAISRQRLHLLQLHTTVTLAMRPVMLAAADTNELTHYVP
jgi:hypothetical protein